MPKRTTTKSKRATAAKPRKRATKRPPRDQTRDVTTNILAGSKQTITANFLRRDRPL